MSDTMRTTATESEARDQTVVRLLDLFEAVTGRSVGKVTPQGQILRLPKPCLDLCLAGETANAASCGCSWLKARIARHPPGDQARIICQRGQTAEVIRAGEPPNPLMVFAVGPGADTHPEANGRPPLDVAGQMDAHINKVVQLAGVLGQQEEENVRLAEEVLRCYEQLNILYELTRAFAGASGVDDLYRIALIRVAGAVQADVALLFDEQGRLRASYGTDDGSAGGMVHPWVTALNGPGREAVLRALSRGITGPAPDQADDDLEGFPGPLLLVPLVTTDKVIGAALFGRPGTDRPFRTDERSMAQALLGHATLNLQLYRLFDDLHQMSVDVVRAMVTAIDAKDSYTGNHSERVAQWSRFIGQELGMSAHDLQIMEWGARLHDVGKIGTRESVLGKAGPLTPEEFEHIKEHPVTSYEVLKPIHRLAPVLPGVRHHHEHWDGSGYPDGLAGESIPLFARVIQTADVFDALTSSRSYRRAYAVNEALGIMRREAGTCLDPHIVQSFVRLIERVRSERPELFAHIPADASEAASSVADGGGGA